MTPWWRRLATGIVLGLAVVAVIAAAAVANLPQPPGWGAAAVAGGAMAVGLLVDPLKRITGDWFERPRRRRRVLEAHLRMRDRRGRPRRVRDCADAVGLGVHPAMTTDETHPGRPPGPLPPYVPRDAHDALRRALADGGLVIVEGRSAAGKSRLAYEAMHAYAPGHWLIVPETPEALRELRKAGVTPRRAVIWLDDLERYLAGGALDSGVLDALCPPGRGDVVLLATLRAEARRELAAPELESSVKRAADEVLRRARTVHLGRDLSPEERTRAERHRADPRIAAALDQAAQTTAAGFAEHLAAGPAALDRWRSARDGAHPVAGAIVSAAVDVRRAGFVAPIPGALIEELYEHYLEPRDRVRRDLLPGFAAGLAAATEPVRGASGCLNAAGAGTYEPFDYLTDHVQHTGSVRDVPGVVWDAALRYAADEDVFAVAFAAYHAGRTDVSEAGYRRAAGIGHATAMSNLAALLDQAGQAAEAETWYRRAVDAGHVTAMRDLGNLLKRDGRTAEAERWYRRAIEAGHLTAMHNLAVLLTETGRPDEAETWWRRAAERGHFTAMHNLAIVAKRAGRPDEAEKWWRQAAAAGHVQAMHNLATLLYETGRDEEAATWWRRAAADRESAANFGDLLRQHGRVQEAEERYRRAADNGDVSAIRSLIGLLRETGRGEEAGRWLRRLEARPHDAPPAGDSGHA